VASSQHLDDPPTTLHKLRHYSATELIRAGVDVRTVAGRLGHADGGTTLAYYAAWVCEADQRASRILMGQLPLPAAPRVVAAPPRRVRRPPRRALRTKLPGRERAKIAVLGG
jgi:hypothetical protein